MGSHNYLATAPREYIAFRWGFIREIVYNPGDAVSWDVWGRPAQADDITEVPGYYMRAGEPAENPMEYAKIVLSGDVLLSFSPSTEEEFEALSERTEAILTDLIYRFQAGS